jgi:diguanylate cyclase (GGDEF)-like protein
LRSDLKSGANVVELPMRADPVATADSEKFAATTLLWLQIFVMAVGVVDFSFAPDAVERPAIAAAGLILLACAAVAVRAIPALHRKGSRQHLFEILMLGAGVTLLAIATGAARSPLLSLYLIPVAAVALVFARWWWVLCAGAVVVALGFALGAITPQLVVTSTEFHVQLLNTFAPGVCVAAVLAASIQQMRRAIRRIADLASTDRLTGLLNLKAFEEIVQQEHRRAERFGRTYMLVMIDVDNVGQINEQLGHEAGNQIISAVAAAISRSIRNADSAARLGGDQFVVLLTEVDAAVGAALAQRMRNNVYAGTVSVANRLLRANISLGTACYPDDHLYPKELMILAEQRMRQDRDVRRQAS